LKVDALLFIEDKLTDKEIILNNIFFPESIEKKLEEIGSIDEIYYSLPDSYSGKLKAARKSIKRDDRDDIAFWKELFRKTGSDHMIKIFVDSPFLDPEIIKEMLDIHLNNLAEFTYSENLPSGFSCEIFSKDLIDTIPETGEKTLALSDVIKSNINQFDVELYYREPDIRNKRISFRSCNARDKKIMENIHTHLERIPTYSEIEDTINLHPELIYLGPSYLEIELTGRCELDCIFCYRKTLKEVHEDIAVDLYKKILSDLKYFNLPYSVCLGGSGEPMMHNNFYEILELTEKEDLIQNIVIETNGIYADSNFKNFLLSRNDPRIKLIFNLNGLDEETYHSIHGFDGFRKAFNNITSIAESINGSKTVYLQIMKINETEEYLDRYYDFWEKYKIPIILQKQNTFIGRIADRRYSDLSPLERAPCWHLQRDLYILSDGRVAFCKQDVDGAHSTGSITSEDIKEIWARSIKHFLNDYKSDYATSPDCKSCDEWYTFNL
jgi:spiro-SPASM protein